MPISLLPEWLRATGAALAMIATSVLAGRLAWHADQVRRGRRRLWSRELLLEGPAVAALALLTWAATDYLALSPGQTSGVGVILGWLGPRGIEALAIRLWRRPLPSPEPLPKKDSAHESL